MDSSPSQKYIQIYPSGYKLHTAYKSLISNPPKGYNFIFEEKNEKRDLFDKLKKIWIVRESYHIFTKLFNTMGPFYFFFGNAKKDNRTNLIYSIGVVYRGNDPWILDLIDHPLSITGYKLGLFNKNKSELIHALSSNSCKKIICSHSDSLKLIRKMFPKNVSKKSIVIHTAIPSQAHIPRNTNPSKINILFMGSINNPDDFYIKGGIEAIESIKRVNSNINIELIIRCKVPPEVHDMVKNSPHNIKILEDQLPFEKIQEMYRKADIFLLPGHHFHLMACLEAMSYGLPIIVLDTYAFKDYVKNNLNGYRIKPSKKIKAYLSKDYPNNLRSDEFIQEIHQIDEKVVGKIAEKIEYLINNPSIRVKMGEQSFNRAKTVFSIELRNKKMKKIFDEVFN